MERSWGPDRVMHKALAASTPNVPWMRLGSPTAWDMDGGGTSASAPQIAAACANWLSVDRARVPADWRRVAACRHAVFETVADRASDLKEIGVGLLNARGALDAKLGEEIVGLANLPDGGGVLPHIAPDEIGWPFFQLLFGLDPPGPGVDEMYHLEARQLAYRSTNRELEVAMNDYPDGKKWSGAVRRRLQEDFVNEPDMSRTLRTHLRSAIRSP